MSIGRDTGTGEGLFVRSVATSIVDILIVATATHDHKITLKDVRIAAGPFHIRSQFFSTIRWRLLGHTVRGGQSHWLIAQR